MGVRKFMNDYLLKINISMPFGGELRLKCEPDSQSAARSRKGRHGAAVDGYGILDDGKAKAGAAEFAATSLIDSVEAFEKMFQMLWLYSGTIVAHRELI